MDTDTDRPRVAPLSNGTAPDAGLRLPVGPGTLDLLGEVMFQAPLVARVLDAYLKDRGADPSRRWRLVLTGAEVVPDEDEGGGEGQHVG